VTPKSWQKRRDSLIETGKAIVGGWTALCLMAGGPVLLVLNINKAWESHSYVGVFVVVTIFGGAAFLMFDYGRRQERIRRWNEQERIRKQDETETR